MTVAPSLDALAAAWGIDLSDAERADYRALVDGMAETLATVEAAPAPAFETLHGSPERHDDRAVAWCADPDREAGSTTRATGADPSAGTGERSDAGSGAVEADRDPYNAWTCRCRVPGAADGPLAGWTVGVKDSVAVAGVPCTAGSRALAEFEPLVDATVVGRLLDAGATLTGKHNMDAFALGDAGELGDFGPTLNPHDPSRLAGGSSSGSAAAVAAGECDLAVGTDQAGSVRTPAAWCGVVGVKPTYGLVPYTGIFGMDLGFDHAGVLARTVPAAARALAVLAGEDRQPLRGASGAGQRLDPRQPRGVGAADYAAAADRDAAGLTVGLLAEGFGWDHADPRVSDRVRTAVERLGAAGVDVVEVSVPDHRLTPALVGTAAAVGAAVTFRQGGGTTAPGWHWADGRAAFDAAVARHPDALSPAVVATLLFARECWEQSGWSGYARAKNSLLALGDAYDDRLEACDALAMPTSPVPALEHDPETGRVARVERLATLPVNTGGANQTGHPALSVPCGAVDGLPVGLQLVGRRFDEPTLFRLAAAVESHTDGGRVAGG